MFRFQNHIIISRAVETNTKNTYTHTYIKTTTTTMNEKHINNKERPNSIQNDDYDDNDD